MIDGSTLVVFSDKVPLYAKSVYKATKVPIIYFQPFNATKTVSFES
jgi:hypothetical protein